MSNEKCCEAIAEGICCDDKNIVNIYFGKNSSHTGGSTNDGNSGTYDHDKLENRNLGIQHDASAIGFADGETFQEKYDKGELTGPQGEKGVDGFSPEITVAEDTDESYVLNIKTATDEFETPNLKVQGTSGKWIDEMSHIYYDTLITGKETLTNQWRDGKPVYQILIDYGPVPQGVTAGTVIYKDVVVDISNIDLIWIDNAYMTIDSRTNSYPLNFTRMGTPISNNNVPGIWAIVIDKVEHSFAVRIHNSTGTVYNQYNAYFVMRYTKTTDVVMPSYQMPIPYFDLTTLDVEYRTNEIWNSNPVYKKQIYIANLGSVLGFNSVSHGISDIDMCVKMDWSLINPTGTTFTSTVQFSSNLLLTGYSMSTHFDANRIVYYLGADRTGIGAYFTLYYTKTTDTPTAHSMIPAIVQETGDSTIQTMSQKAITDAINIFTDNEIAQQKAMLQWANAELDKEYWTGKRHIDGKKIYGKKIDFGVLPDNTTKNVSHNILNIDAFTSVNGLIKANNGNWVSLSYQSTSDFIAVLFAGSTNGYIGVITNQNASGWTRLVVTIEYTCTDR